MVEMPPQRTAVVTVTYNSETVVEDFLESLLTNSTEAEIVLYVIDNQSSDRTLEIVDAYQDKLNIHVLANDENRGVAAGNNQGINAALDAGLEWVLLLNNDTIIPKGTIAGMIALAQKENLKVLSPAIEATEPLKTIWFDGGTIYPARGMKVVHDRMGMPTDKVVPGLRTTPYASTCCLLVHRSVFEEIGGMDTDFFVYFDDVDFSIRAQAAGFKYWLSGDLMITHKASSLTGGFLGSFTLRWLTRNWVLVARKHLPPIRRGVSFSYIQIWMLARVLARRDKPAHYVTRQRAFFEGLTAPISADGNLLRNSDVLPHDAPIAQILRKEAARVSA